MSPRLVRYATTLAWAANTPRDNEIHKRDTDKSWEWSSRITSYMRLRQQAYKYSRSALLPLPDPDYTFMGYGIVSKFAKAILSSCPETRYSAWPGSATKLSSPKSRYRASTSSSKAIEQINPIGYFCALGRLRAFIQLDYSIALRGLVLARYRKTVLPFGATRI